MQVTLKLYAGLAEYLPYDAVKNVALLEIEAGTSANQLMKKLSLPKLQVHLVLLNGVYLDEAARNQPMNEQDVLAVWPPVAGG